MHSRFFKSLDAESHEPFQAKGHSQGSAYNSRFFSLNPLLPLIVTLLELLLIYRSAAGEALGWDSGE